MKSTYILFTLLVVVCYARQEYGNRDNNRNGNRSDDRSDRKSSEPGQGFRQWYQPSETSTQEPSTTSTTVTTTIVPCSECQNIPISISGNFAGQCMPYWEGATCTCLCGDVFCKENEIIDRSTCKPDGKLSDCKCISVSTDLPTTPSSIDITTTTPTTGTGYLHV